MQRYSAFVYIFILLIALSLTGCTDSGSSDNDSVQVSLSVSTSSPYSRIISANDGFDSSKLAYYYKATPMWTGSDFTGIQGVQSTFKKINNYTPGKNLGLFAQGKWFFEVEARLIDENEADETQWDLAFSGSAEVYISTSNFEIAVPVARNSGINGAVAITVRAPTVSESDSLSISYSGTQNGSIAAGNIAVTRSEGDDRWTTFTVNSTTLKAGTYTFFLTYNDGTENVGGASVAFNINPGMTANITGTVESGLWQNETVSFTGLHSFGVTLTTVGNKLEIADNESLTYTCTKNPGSLDIDTYEWYVNGALQTGQTSSTFTLVASRFDCDYCSVSCVAKATEGDEEYLAYSAMTLIIVRAD